MCTLIKNMAECLTCGDVIQSTHRHDFVMCKCGDIAVDGGNDYTRRVYETWARWRDLSIYRPCGDKRCPEMVEENIYAEAV